jgi:hypothetical protein
MLKLSIKSLKRTGSLFEKPFHKIEVKNEAYFSALIAYIHFNPKNMFLFLTLKPTHIQVTKVICKTKLPN